MYCIQYASPVTFTQHLNEQASHNKYEAPLLSIMCQTKGMEGTFLISFTLVSSGWLLKSVFHHKRSLIRLHMSVLSVFSLVLTMMQQNDQGEYTTKLPTGGSFPTTKAYGFVFTPSTTTQIDTDTHTFFCNFQTILKPFYLTR